MDLRVMSPTSYQTALPRGNLFSITINSAIVAIIQKSLLGDSQAGDGDSLTRKQHTQNAPYASSLHPSRLIPHPFGLNDPINSLPSAL